MYSCGQVAAYVLANVHSTDSTKSRTSSGKGAGKMRPPQRLHLKVLRQPRDGDLTREQQTNGSIERYRSRQT